MGWWLTLDFDLLSGSNVTFVLSDLISTYYTMTMTTTKLHNKAHSVRLKTLFIHLIGRFLLLNTTTDPNDIDQYGDAQLSHLDFFGHFLKTGM